MSPKQERDEDFEFRDEDSILDDDIDIEFFDDDKDERSEREEKTEKKDHGDNALRQEVEDLRIREQRALETAAEAEARNAGTSETVKTLAKEKMEWQINFAVAKDAEISATIKDLNSQLAKAEEEGETEKKIEITEKLAEARESRTSLRASKDALESRYKSGEYLPDSKDSDKKETNSDPRGGEVDPEGKAWLAKNPWFNAPASEDEIVKRHHTLQIDKELLKDGKFKVGTRSYYEELEKRVNKKMSERSSTGGDSTKKRSTVGPAGNGGEDRPANKQAVRLDKADLREMRNLGLDPRDQVHLTEYARNKRETDRDEGDRPSPKFPIRPISKSKK